MGAATLDMLMLDDATVDRYVAQPAAAAYLNRRPGTNGA